jgi:hypothetical protein
MPLLVLSQKNFFILFSVSLLFFFFPLAPNVLDCFADVFSVQEPVSFDKISHRIQRLAEGLSYIEPLLVSQRVIQGVYDGVHTTELDTLAAETSAYMTTLHPNYEVLAARLAVSNLHKETQENFLDVITRLHKYINKKNGRPASLIADDVFEVVQNNAEEIQKVLDFKRDYDYSYFGFKTLCRSYLLRLDVREKQKRRKILRFFFSGPNRGASSAHAYACRAWNSQEQFEGGVLDV